VPTSSTNILHVNTYNLALVISSRKQGITRNSGSPARDRGVESPSETAALIESERFVGRVLGEKYRVVRWIADGGMGSVFEAENTWTQRRVAVKILDAEVSKQPDRVKRFIREARSATKIEHPNIVEVLDMGEDKKTGTFFLVQELLRGRDLRRSLREAPGHKLEPEMALAVLVPIMEALEAAHQLGIIHRDVKPANIFLAKQGTHIVPKLIDFGLSKLLRRDPSENGATTGGGMPLGTPLYMSPEQARGDIELDGRADLWSIAVVMYECLTGRLPYEGANAGAVLLKIASERPRPVDHYADVPAELAAIIHRALEVDRDRRWQSMTQLLHAVREFQQPILAMAAMPTAISGTMRAARPVDPDESNEIRAAAPLVAVRPPAVVERVNWQPTSPAPPPSGPVVATRPLREGALRLGVSVATPTARASLRELSKVLGAHFQLAVAPSYAQIVDALAEGEIDVAWLPPVAYVRAVRSGAARLMLTLERDGRRSYAAAIVARAFDGPSRLDELHGLRVAWLDPWSAAGYLVPRCMLRAMGIEPDRTFAAQAFHGSYDAISRALIDGSADVGAMFCRVGENGEITGGAWNDDPRIKPIAVGAESVPGDTICVTATLGVDDAREAIERFIEAVAVPQASPIFREVFGTDRFVAANASRYEGLEAALVADVSVR
jgi:phosphate/phosphite/phosphonate ABC transporter binding protein